MTERAFRHLLGFLKSKAGKAAFPFASPIVDALKGDRAPSLTDQKYVQMIVSGLRGHHEDLAARFTGKTASHFCSTVSRLLEFLGKLGDSRFPPFERRLISFPEFTGDVRSLGSLGWLELASLVGAQAEREALNLVREQAVKEFEKFEHRFEAGQHFLGEGSPPHDCPSPEAWHAIKTAIVAERHSWITTGTSLFGANRRWPSELEAIRDKLLLPDTWRDAGCSCVLDAKYSSTDRINNFHLSSMILGLLGPTLPASNAIMIVFCTDSGWNRQPIKDLPRNPYVFRTPEEIVLGSEAIISSFKTRANHEVVVYLERGEPLTGLAYMAAKEEWGRFLQEYGSSTQSSDYLTVKLVTKAEDTSLLSLLERYSKMTDAIRPLDVAEACADRFFVNLTPRYGIRPATLRTAHFPSSGVLSRDGVTLMAIRKSFLTVKLHATGSVASVRPFASHTGTGVLMPHYLNSNDVREELNLQIRFHQNAVQALVLKERPDAAACLSLATADMEWYRRLASFAGIAAAIGLEGIAAGKPENGLLVFEPTFENLRELFLTHLALRRCRKRIGLARWAVQVLPLLAIAKAFGRALRAQGLWPAYLKAARAAHRDLKACQITLPVVMEV
ncbi:hypothetical protein [Aliidongia dinghuensis]|nr:hypothetical protein [Aliidongia dinghuensis]